MNNKVGNLLVSNDSTLVTNIYINADLSTSEVVNILSGLTYHDMEGYEEKRVCVFRTSMDTYLLTIEKKESWYAICGYNYTFNEMEPNDKGSISTVFFVSSDAYNNELGIDFVGWNPTENFDQSLAFNHYGETLWNEMPVGDQNHLLTSLFSMNEDFTVNEVNDPILTIRRSTLVDIANAIREVSGDTGLIKVSNLDEAILSLKNSD